MCVCMQIEHVNSNWFSREHQENIAKGREQNYYVFDIITLRHYFMTKVIFLSLWQYFTQIMLKKAVPICFITALSVNLHGRAFWKSKWMLNWWGCVRKHTMGELMPESPEDNYYITIQTVPMQRVSRRVRTGVCTCLYILVYVFSTESTFFFHDQIFCFLEVSSHVRQLLFCTTLLLLCPFLWSTFPIEMLFKIFSPAT